MERGIHVPNSRQRTCSNLVFYWSIASALTGQLEAAIGGLLRKSVVKQGKQCAGALMCIIPDRIESGLLDGGVGGAEHVEKQAPDLAVGA